MRSVEKLTKELDKKRLERQQLSSEIYRLWKESGDLKLDRVINGEKLDYWTCFEQEYQPLLDELTELETGVARRVAALRAPQVQPQPEPVWPAPKPLPSTVVAPAEVSPVPSPSAKPMALKSAEVSKPKKAGPLKLERGEIPPLTEEIEELVRSVAITQGRKPEVAVDRYHQFHLQALSERQLCHLLVPEHDRKSQRIQQLHWELKHDRGGDAAVRELAELTEPFVDLECEYRLHRNRLGRFTFELRRLIGEKKQTYIREK